jgi:hypothetical protein
MTRENICNLALSRIGVRSRISSLSEGSEEANLFDLVYDFVLELTLEQSPWSFAQERRALLLLEEQDSTEEWTFKYQVPANCVRPLRIESAGARNVAQDQLVKWQLESDPDGNRKIILTDEEDAVLVYTRRDVIANLYPAHFVSTLAWNLAAEIVGAMPGKADMGEYAMKMARIAASEAGATNANIMVPDNQLDSEFVRVREG